MASPSYSRLSERLDTPASRSWALHARARADRAAGRDVIMLTVGDPDFDTPAPIQEAAIAAIRSGDTHYVDPMGRRELRATIAAAHAAATGMATGVENVIVTAGAQNALFSAALAVLDPSDEAVALEPTYVTYQMLVPVSGARLSIAPSGPDLRPDMAGLAARIGPRTRAILYASPNNPSGIMLDEAELAALADLARTRDLWVIADEVYADLVFEGRHRSIASLPGMAERTLVVGGVSKSHAMTGWRIGWMIGPTEAVRHAGHIAQGMHYGLQPFAQEAARAALSLGGEIAAEMREAYRRRRDLVVDALAGAPGIAPLRPPAGMFVLLDVRGSGQDAEGYANALYEATGVALLDASGFGPNLAGMLRLSLGAPDATLARAAGLIAAHAARRYAA
jgi:arginine:pyruvate transaminase